MDVQYIGRAGKRTIRTVDLENQGISGFETTSWLKLETKTVQDAGGQWLIDNLSAEFKKDESATTLSASTKASSSERAESASKTSSKG